MAAIGRHRAAGVLDRPGSADLSAHVDFTAFAAAAGAAGSDIHGPATQRQFLLNLGAAERCAALRRRASPEQRAALDSGYHRLIDPAEMGTLFKAMAVTSPGLPAPGGFGLGIEAMAG